MNSVAVNRLRAWTQTDIPREPYFVFRIVFAAIWLVYDLMDLKLGGTRGYLWSVWDANYEVALPGLQYILIACEACLVVGIFPRSLAFVAFVARAFEARLFAVNDFLYVAVVFLLLSQCDCRNPGAGRPRTAAAWPRDVFILQTAWIYLATAFLKLSPAFLSGGDLFVRQNYMAEALSWPYPAFFRSLIAGLAGNAWLAVLAVLGEGTMGVLLLAWLFRPRRRKFLRLAASALCVAIHGFAIAALNVFFFSLAMIAQVVILTWVPKID